MSQYGQKIGQILGGPAITTSNIKDISKDVKIGGGFLLIFSLLINILFFILAILAHEHIKNKNVENSKKCDKERAKVVLVTTIFILSVFLVISLSFAGFIIMKGKFKGEKEGLTETTEQTIQRYNDGVSRLYMFIMMEIVLLCASTILFGICFNEMKKVYEGSFDKGISYMTGSLIALPIFLAIVIGYIIYRGYSVRKSKSAPSS